jgi:hypothetical protein
MSFGGGGSSPGIDVGAMRYTGADPRFAEQPGFQAARPSRPHREGNTGDDFGVEGGKSTDREISQGWGAVKGAALGLIGGPFSAAVGGASGYRKGGKDYDKKVGKEVEDARVHDARRDRRAVNTYSSVLDDDDDDDDYGGWDSGDNGNSGYGDGDDSGWGDGSGGWGGV